MHDLETALFQQRSDYLTSISMLVNLPHLKTRYRWDARKIRESHGEKGENVTRSCSKCLLYPYETQLHQSVKPQARDNILRKYNKESSSRYQIQQAKQLKQLQQQLIVKCSTCKNTEKYPLKKPERETKETRIIMIPNTPGRKRKKKKKKNNDKTFAGIDQSAVAEAQQQTKGALTKSFISLELTPIPAKKRKFDEVIVIEDSPKPSLKKSKKQQENRVTLKKSHAKTGDLNMMKETVKEVETKLQSTSYKKSRLRMKCKIRKMKESIQIMEQNESKPKSSLLDFLSTLSR